MLSALAARMETGCSAFADRRQPVTETPEGPEPPSLAPREGSRYDIMDQFEVANKCYLHFK